MSREDEYRARTLAKDYQDTFSGQANEQQAVRVLFDILNACDFMITNFNHTNQSIALEAKKSVAIHIMQRVALAPQYKGAFGVENLTRLVSMAEKAKQYQDVIDYEAQQQTKED